MKKGRWKRSGRNRDNRNRNHGNRNNGIKLELSLVLIILSLNTILSVVLMAVWIIGSLPADQVMVMLRAQSSTVSNWQLWMSSEYGAAGFRYLISLLFHDPMIMVMVFFNFIIAGTGLVLADRFFGRLDLEKKRLCQKLEHSSLQTERTARQIRLDADRNQDNEKEKIKELSLQDTDEPGKAQNQLETVFPMDAHQDEFPLLGIDSSFYKKEADDLNLAGRLMEEKQLARYQYENVFHQTSSKLSTLYFLLEDLTQQDPIAKDPGILSSLTDCETVLDECTALLKSELHHSVYAGFRLDQEIVLCIHEKRTEIKRKRLKVSLHLEPVTISGNTLWLKQVFETLLANAIDFSKPEGTLRIISKLHNNQIQIQFENTLHNTMPSDLASGNQALPEGLRRYQTQRAGHFGIGHDLVGKVLKSHQGHLETKMEGKIFRAAVFLPYSQLDQYSR